LGDYISRNWADAQALNFARSVFGHASALGGSDEVLAGRPDGEPPPPLRQN
jgi:hypothetical protein